MGKERALGFYQASSSPVGGLIHSQEGFHELAFATNGHAGKPFEPAALRDGGLSIQPRGQQSQLIGWNAAEPDAVEQMLKQRGRKMARRT